MTNMSRWIKRTKKFVEARHKEHDPNSRAAARRRKQMVEGKLTPSNGVVPEYMCDACMEPVGTTPGLCATCAEQLEKADHAD